MRRRAALPEWVPVRREGSRPWVVLAAGGVLETALLPGRILNLQVDYGLQVSVALSRAARDFVTPLALAALTGHAVYTGPRQLELGTGRPLHLVLADADLVVLYPASARVLAQCATGAVTCPLTRLFAFTPREKVLIAPALHPRMDRALYEGHLATLEARGCGVLARESLATTWAEVEAELVRRLSLTRRTRSPEEVFLDRLRARKE